MATVATATISKRSLIQSLPRPGFQAEATTGSLSWQRAGRGQWTAHSRYAAADGVDRDTRRPDGDGRDLCRPDRGDPADLAAAGGGCGPAARSPVLRRHVRGAARVPRVRPRRAR